MKIPRTRWDWHRVAVDRLNWLRPFGRGSLKKVLFISAPDPICYTQYYPFFDCADELERTRGLQLREVALARWQAGDHPYRDADVAAVIVQTWLDVTPDELAALILRIRKTYPEARVAYADWFAPCDLRYAEALSPLVDAYLKKQVLRRREDYNRPLLGDTNLTDYYSRRFGLADKTTCYKVPTAFWDKLILTPHFAYSQHMRNAFLGPFPEGERPHDLHSRIAVKGTPWYVAMRQEALDASRALPGTVKVINAGLVSQDRFFEEMRQSRLCFSPFGYGEVCWRDFEAMFSGSLLLKPDMSHLDCYPEAFVPYETYVPLAWDLSDFQDKVLHYLAHPDESRRITRNAFQRLRTYFEAQPFLADMRPLWERLNLA